MHLSLTYPSWYILFCLLAGALYAFALYWPDTRFKEIGESYKKWLWAFAVIRFITVAMLAFFLLSPLIRTRSNKIEKPIVVLAQDNSQSIRSGMSVADSAAYTQHLNELVKELEKNYDVKLYSFGSALHENLQTDFTEKSTDISNALSQIQSVYSNQNLGAVILASDGIYNQGSSPVYLNFGAVPVYTIGLGDTTTKKDAYISRVLNNRIVYIGDFFSLKVQWHADYCAGAKPSLMLSRINGSAETKLEERTISIDGNSADGSEDFLLKADQPGVIHYRITMSTVDGEVTTANNVKDVFVEVAEKKEKILLVANAPHPDVAALKQSIEVNKNYSVDVALGNYSGAMDDYSLVILDQIPSDAQNGAALLQNIHAKKKPILYILGAQTNASLFNNQQTAVSITGANGSATETQSVAAGNFSLFTLPDNVVAQIGSFPPLQSPFGEYKASPGAAVLVKQKIGSVVTNYPLILFQQEAGSRVGIVCGEGLWRWRMYDYMQHQNQDAFNTLISAFVQYLTAMNDEKQFRVSLEKEKSSGGGRIFSENEPIVFDAELLNESNQLINTPDVSLTIKNDSGKEFPYIFTKTSSSYALNAGFFPTGNYTYTAATTYNSKALTDAGSFSVMPLQLEFASTRANHQLLYSLSSKTGGQLFYPAQLTELAKTIEARQDIKPVLYSTTHTQPLINLRWLLLPLILLLGLEWFLRKYQGAY